jgi:hypothetical protein
MKNLIKKGPKFLRYKAHSFKCGDYTLEINGEKYPVELKYCGPEDMKSDSEPAFDSSHIHFTRDLIKESGSIPRRRIYPGQEFSDEKYVPGVNIGIGVPAERFVSGEVKIYHGDELIKPDDVITSDENWIIDTSKVNLGSLWNLTIDGDPRFQNTMIMILHVWSSIIEFAYQTKVIYSPEYSHVEVAEGRIDFTPRMRNSNEPIDIFDYVDKIHLTLVKDNTNNGADMDRQHEDDTIYPRSYGVGGYREIYPPIEFRKRAKCDPHMDYDEGDEY